MRTEIWDKGASQAERYAEGLANNGYSPERFGAFVREVFEKGRTRYPIVPRKFLNSTVPRLLPDRLLDRLIARIASGLG